MHICRRVQLCAAAAALVAAGSALAAGPPTVAVMPFRDLSGTSPLAGEAIRETVSSDLKDVSGVRVIERANLDRVLTELKLQERRADLDPASAVQVGKLLGATLIVVGAYQKTGQEVRLTARFVRVETGEVVGSAKVDGRTTSFLRLQDAVTEELLRSAGLAEKAKKVRARAPQRPPIKSLRTLEMYGQAVLAKDDAERKHLLRAAVDEDAGFTYASRDLAELEARLRRYQAQADLAKEKEIEALRAEVARETDPQKRSIAQMRLLSELQSTHRYYELKTFAHAIIAENPPPSPFGGPSLSERAWNSLIEAEDALKEEDAVLRDGDAFLQRYSGSLFFGGIKYKLERIIKDRREAEAGKAKLPQELAALSTEQRWNLCRIAVVYRSAHQLREAQRLYRACSEAGGSEPRGNALHSLVYVDIQLGDWTALRRDMEALEKEDRALYQSALSTVQSVVPADG